MLIEGASVPLFAIDDSFIHEPSHIVLLSYCRSEDDKSTAIRLLFQLANPFLQFATLENRPMHSSIGSDRSSRSSEAKLFGIEFSDLHVSKEDSVKPRCDQLDSQLFEAKYFADEYSALAPADITAIVDSSQQETLRVRELWQLAQQSDRTGDV
jgi:hypothetical protein